ncbi:hypothetical protein F5Y14DRAFT_115810 [Nemania sp. NC0429]|nr:hypothetical protein F5Y14DRAFT_115810 [Nemania sp. NC0429]
MTRHGMASALAGACECALPYLTLHYPSTNTDVRMDVWLYGCMHLLYSFVYNPSYSITSYSPYCTVLYYTCVERQQSQIQAPTQTRSCVAYIDTTLAWAIYTQYINI